MNSFHIVCIFNSYAVYIQFNSVVICCVVLAWRYRTIILLLYYGNGSGNGCMLVA